MLARCAVVTASALSSPLAICWMTAEAGAIQLPQDQFAMQNNQLTFMATAAQLSAAVSAQAGPAPAAAADAAAADATAPAAAGE